MASLIGVDEVGRGAFAGPVVAAAVILPARCVLPALESGRWTTALLNGAAFGFLAYATYDLTNHATLSVWDTRITLADMAWGTFVSGVASVAGYFVTDWMVGRG